MTLHGSGPVARAKIRAHSRDNLRLLASLAELRAEIARQPLVAHQREASKLKEEIRALAETRQELRVAVDAMASDDAPLSTAAYLSARSEDVRRAQAGRYLSLAHTEAELAGLKETAARARARADILARLSRKAHHR
jgi:hypothetical protein